jgi:2-keto-4-pentenoate hydratase
VAEGTEQAGDRAQLSGDRAGLLAALRTLERGQELAGPAAATVAALDGDVDDGLRWQAEALRATLADGARLAGWKVGLSSRGSRDLMGPGVRPFGYILDSGVTLTGGQLTATALAGCRLEPELCLVLGTPLSGPAVTPADARAAVRAAAPSFEIITPSLPGQPSDAAKAAARMNQWGIVAGAETEPPPDITTTGAVLRHDGHVVGSAAMTQDIIDDPFLSLARLCAALAPYGLGLEPGQRVITGSLLAAVPAAPGHWEADFGPLGTAALTIA